MLTVGFSIPVYDTPIELEKCLLSLSKQTVLPVEIAVVDDTSPRHLEIQKICQNFGVWYIYANYGRKRFRKCQAFNLGASVLSTDIVNYSQGDMAYPSDYVEKHLRLHQRYENIAIYPTVYHYNDLDELQKLTCFNQLDAIPFDKAFETKIPFSTMDYIIPGNGIGLACNLSVSRKNDIGWDNFFISTGADEDDYYHRLLESGIFPAIFSDIIAYHIHCDIRDVSFFDIGMDEAAAYYAKKQRYFLRHEPISLIEWG